MPIYHQGEAYDLDHDVYSGAEAVHQARRWVRMPIDYWRWWQRGAIDAAQTLSISTAICHIDGQPLVAYVAYVTTAYRLIVKSATIIEPLSDMVWTQVASIANCKACALEFEGQFLLDDADHVQFWTEEKPWLFYLTTSGQLKAGVVGSAYQALVSSGVADLDAVRGVTSRYRDVDQGLMVFYLIDGDIYYQQRTAGVWGTQQAMPLTLETGYRPVRIKAHRTFDWRIALQVMDQAGKIYEIFTRAYTSGWSGVENVSTVLDIKVSTTEIGYYYIPSTDNTFKVPLPDSEYMRENVSAMLDMKIVTLWGIDTQIRQIENIDDGSGNWGYVLRIIWEHPISSVQGNELKFILIDNNGTQWGCTQLTVISPIETIATFQNFNNAINPIRLTYEPGTMLGEAGQAVQAKDVSFTAVNLVPYTIVLPSPISAINPIDWSET